MSSSNSSRRRSPFYWVDRVVTPPADALVRSNLFADAVAGATRIEVHVRRGVEQKTTWLLHALNLPAAADTRRILARLAALEARIRDLSDRLDDQ